MGLVQYSYYQTDLKTRRVYYTGSTALERGAVLVYEAQADLDSFEKGPGVDVAIPTGTDSEVLAGILCDSSVGSEGGWVDIYVPRPGDVIWCQVASGLDNGDGVTIAAQQHFADSGAFSAGDIGVCLMDEDATDNPFGGDDLAPILFCVGVA